MAWLLFCMLILIQLGPGEPSEEQRSLLRGASPDRASLLAFFSSITADPHNTLENWGAADIHVCNWTGVTCKPAKHRVVQLILSGRDLQSAISPAVANLSFLEVLDLSGNSLTGGIPRELGFLSRLTQLSLASNLLEGAIPAELGLLRSMFYLDLGGNQLSGPIPKPLFCNTSLQYVDLSNNSLSGEIPLSSECRLVDLRFLLLWSNNLHGTIPSSLSNSTRLEWIDLESNYLSGDLPSQIFDKTPFLQFLYLSYNNFSSHDSNTNLKPFFASLLNCSNLQELELAGNNLEGELPSLVGSLSTKLLQLHLEQNLIFGPIPPNISNLVNLTYLNLSNNYLNGSIPPDISRLKRLERLYLSNNMLSGEIPVTLSDIPRLGLLDMSGNMLSGPIPDALSNLSQLRRLMIHNNQLSGRIPSSLGNCENLETLDLSYNRLSGRIPTDLAALGSLKLYLNLSHNLLEGSLPLELSKLDMILALDLSSNNFSGMIPPQLGSCVALEYLNISNNFLQGPLPSSVGGLPYLEVLDMSSNRLAGGMPPSLEASSSLKLLNFSFNNFSGVIPNEGVFLSLTVDSFLGNPGLCGLMEGMSNCTTKRVHRHKILRIVLTLIGTPCILCLFACPLVMRLRARSQLQMFHKTVLKDAEEEKKSRHDYPRISYRQLVEATGGFSDLNLIGSGRFGHVYKGVLPGDSRIAVKVLDPKNGGDDSKSFKTECEVLKRTRHRNLIRIITACSRPDFKALVLPLMANGSLESHLYLPEGSRSNINLFQMVNIISDIAEGMTYLHHYSPVRVIHCDLKPSNVLLDEDMTALVSDFGISRLVKGAGDESPDSSACISTTGLLHGSVGYIAPEYGLGAHPSTQGDVYSFGVLLLEIITGKRPTDVIFHESLSLHEWVKSHYPDNIDTLISQAKTWDSPLNDSFYYKMLSRDVFLELIELGLACTQYSPSMRPTMMDVAQEIALLKQDLSRNLH